MQKLPQDNIISERTMLISVNPRDMKVRCLDLESFPTSVFQNNKGEDACEAICVLAPPHACHSFWITEVEGTAHRTAQGNLAYLALEGFK